MATKITTPTTTACPAGDRTGHRTFGGTVCALCGSPVTEEAPPVSPAAFRDGEALAYRRVLGLLQSLPEDLASRGRDEGRGAAHAVKIITEAVLALAEDAEVDL